MAQTEVKSPMKKRGAKKTDGRPTSEKKAEKALRGVLAEIATSWESYLLVKAEVAIGISERKDTLKASEAFRNVVKDARQIELF
jgi:hypothetical protein